MGIEIAQIKNAELKALALEVDKAHKKDGYIDESEINVFNEKAKTLLSENKCTVEDFDELFVQYPKDSTVSSDVYEPEHQLESTKKRQFPETIDSELQEIEQLQENHRHAQNVHMCKGLKLSWYSGEIPTLIGVLSGAFLGITKTILNIGKSMDPLKYFYKYSGIGCGIGLAAALAVTFLSKTDTGERKYHVARREYEEAGYEVKKCRWILHKRWTGR